MLIRYVVRAHKRPNEGWEHTREAKDKISAAMKLAAVRRKAATANQHFFRVAAFKSRIGRVHIMREGLKNTLCGGMKSYVSLEITKKTVNCPRCLQKFPSGARF